MKKFLITTVLCLICSVCFAGGVDLNGSSDYLSNVSLSDEFDMTAGVTIHTFAGWIKPDYAGTAGNFDSRIFFLSEDWSANGDGWGLTAGYATYLVLFTQGQNTGNITHGMVTNSWNHIVAIYDQLNDTVKVYVNAVSKYSNTGYANTSAITTGEIILGRQSGTSQYFDGPWADFAFWNVALSEEEISLLYTSEVQGMPLNVQPDNLIGYWPFDDFQEGVSAAGHNFKNIVNPDDSVLMNNAGVGATVQLTYP